MQVSMPHRCIVVGLAFASLSWVISGASAQVQPSPTLETIRQAWEDREQRVRTVKIEWVERMTIAKGYLSSLFADIPSAREDVGIPAGAVVPPLDTTFDVPSSMTLDGAKLRYTRNDQQWSSKVNGYVLQPEICVYDGDVGKSLLPNGTPSTPYPSAIVRRANPAARFVHMMPILMTYRALLPSFRGFNVESMEPTGGRAIIDNNTCVELQETGSGNTLRIWLDPSLGYVMVRYLSLVQDHVRCKLDIRYVNGPDRNPVPKEWSFAWFTRDGKLESAASATVTKFEIDAAVNGGDFELEFPPGTLVNDSTNPKSEVNYIAKERGKKRNIPREEMRATYEQLIASEPGNALGKKDRSWSIAVGVSVAVAVLAGAILVWRRRSSRKTSL
jgi:hypothetical protein